MSIKVLVYCPGCKHNHHYDDGISECEMGRHTEHRQAEDNGGLCECEYWGAR